MNRTLITLAKLIAATVIALTGTLSVQAPAEAATAVTFCAKWPSGGVHYGEAYANQPVFLVDYSTGAVIRNGATNSAGCGTFSNVPTSKNVWVKIQRVYGNYQIGQAIYSGGTPRYALPGTASVNIGTIYLRLTCSQGIYGYCAGLA